VYVFLRGTPGPAPESRYAESVPGMFVEQPSLERLLALDAALAAEPAAGSQTGTGGSHG
jgi:hypothetical protein